MSRAPITNTAVPRFTLRFASYLACPSAAYCSGRGRPELPTNRMPRPATKMSWLLAGRERIEKLWVGRLTK